VFVTLTASALEWRLLGARIEETLDEEVSA